MSERTDSFDNKTLSPEDMALLQFIESWLALAPPDLAEAAHLAALPHRFELTLLSMLRGTTDGTAILVQRLEQAGLLMAEGTHYTLRPRLRTLLLPRWQSENLTRYRRANRRAAAFYQDRLPGNENDQIEYVYHQLGSDDRRGIETLSEAFEGAWAARQLGLAERFLRVADEQVAVLNAEAQAWLRYFHARLDLAYQRYTESEEALRTLSRQQIEPRLQANVQTTLADRLLQSQRWAEAFERYAEALDLYRALHDSFKVARVIEAQAMAYIHLATSLGGLPEAKFVYESPSQRWLRYIQHAPFLLYRALSRRVAFLPNLYFGTDYQDWIIFRLLYGAIGDFELAIRELALIPRDFDFLPVHDLTLDIEIRLADLYHQVGEWAVAARRFSHLQAATVDDSNDYRRAILHLGQGRAALVKPQIDEAQAHLHAAHRILSRYGDHRALSTTNHLLADAEIRAHDPDAAVSFYIESIKQALAINDLLAATRVWFLLTILRERSVLSPISNSQINALEQSLDRRAYIARFPGTLLVRFRQLARYVVVPLTYLIILLLSPILVFLFFILETTFIEILHIATSSYYDRLPDLIGTLFLLLPIALLPWLTLWVYEFFYLFVGWLFVRHTSLSKLCEHQPKYVVTVQGGIVVRNENGLRELTWDAIERYIIVNRSLWLHPLSLFSRQVLISGRTTFVFEGILSHYHALQQDITRRLQQIGKPIEPEDLSFSFANQQWTILVAGIAILAALVTIFNLLNDHPSPSFLTAQIGNGIEYDLPINTLVITFFLWFLLLFPPIALARLLYNRFVARRVLGSRLPWGPDWPLWLALILLLAWLAAWLGSLTQ